MASLLANARSWVDNFHVNAGAPAEREGRAVWLKQRGRMAWLIMSVANGFFRAAQNPVRTLVKRDAWRKWEVRCFRLLHGPGFIAGCDEDGTPWAELLPGGNRSHELAAHTLTPGMLRAAGRELGRVHAIVCDDYRANWSHGDPHTGNFLYDATDDRARLIDFEVRHLHHLPMEDRHADDLLVLLQDVCGRCRTVDWPTLAAAVLEGYGENPVLGRLKEKLRVPRGIPRLWWAVRTTWMRRAELERRLAELRALLG
jgi:tRNA A-37 threonylcarbamoyl transferase component Bud32